MLNQIACFAFSLVCSQTDISTRRIPNRINYSAILAGFSFSLTQTFFPTDAFKYKVFGAVQLLPFTSAMLGAVAFFFLLLPIYAFRGLGAGDVKMACAIGAFLGIFQAAFAVVAGLIIAGAYSFCVLLWYNGTTNLILALASWSKGKLMRSEPQPPASLIMSQNSLPLAVFFAIGVLLSIFTPVDW